MVDDLGAISSSAVGGRPTAAVDKLRLYALNNLDSAGGRSTAVVDDLGAISSSVVGVRVTAAPEEELNTVGGMATAALDELDTLLCALDDLLPCALDDLLLCTLDDLLLCTLDNLGPYLRTLSPVVGASCPSNKVYWPRRRFPTMWTYVSSRSGRVGCPVLATFAALRASTAACLAAFLCFWYSADIVKSVKQVDRRQ